MNNPEIKTASGKILFGIDYLNLMRWMQWPGENEVFDAKKRGIVDAVARLFLLHWDFSIEEIDQTNAAFFEKANTQSLDDTIDTVINRIYDFIEDDNKAQENLLLEVAAVAQFDDTMLEAEKFILEHLRNKFDFRPSEFDAILKRGWYWRIALDFLGNEYVVASKQQ